MARRPAKHRISKGTKRALTGAQQLILDCAAVDGNESETSKRVEHLFSAIMGYDLFKHITHEYAIHGVGDTVHCDLAIRTELGKTAAPCILVEVKRVSTELALKHLKQVASYAINEGCEWVLLTNGRQWNLYRIVFGQPPRTILVDSWNLLEDDFETLAEKFDLISYNKVKKGNLARLGQKSSVLTPENMLKLILSEESIRSIQRRLRKETGVLTLPEEVVSAVRRLLNEPAAAQMDTLKISLPEKKPRQRKTRQPDIDVAAKPPAVLQRVNPCPPGRPLNRPPADEVLRETD